MIFYIPAAILVGIGNMISEKRLTIDLSIEEKHKIHHKNKTWSHEH